MSEAPRCPVCGWQLEAPAWSRHGPSWDTCPCCGLTFGVEDGTDAGVADEREARAAAHRAWRARWVEAGMPWHSKTVPAPSLAARVAQVHCLGLLTPLDRVALTAQITGILEGRIPLAEGLVGLVKRLSVLEDALPKWDPEGTLRYYAGELDEYPLGRRRELWDPEYLARLDAEREAFEEKVRPAIEAAPRDLLGQLDASPTGPGDERGLR